MCHQCVIESVKDRMMSRRSFFSKAAGAAAGGAAVAFGASAAATPALADGHGKVHDMTHELSADFPTYFGQPGVSVEQVYNFADNGFNLNINTINEHTGTHLDAPLHFSADGQAVNEIPLENLVCPLAVIDIREKAADNPDAQVTPEDLKAYISKYGPIGDHSCVALLSGWDKKAGGDGFRNADDKGTMHFPGFHIEATKMLIEETGATGMASDTLSLDFGPSGDFATHYAWLPTNRYGIECIANLEQVPASGATLVIGAPKMRGGTGGPARIFAMA